MLKGSLEKFELRPILILNSVKEQWKMVTATAFSFVL